MRLRYLASSTRWPCLAWSLLLLATACNTKATPSEPANSSPIVVRVAGKPLTEADVEREIARQPEGGRARYAMPEGRKQLIDSMIRFEVMAQAAEERGLLKDPDIIWFTRQQAVNKLIQKEVGERTAPATISQEDVARYYESHKDKEFSLPAAYHVQHILVADEQLAQRLLVQAQKLNPEDERGFGGLVEKYSQDALTVHGQGDLGFIDASSLVPGSLLEAATKLATPGDIAGPIKTERGFHILRLLGRRAAVVRSLADSDELIRNRLERERRTAALEALVARLRKAANVELLDQKSRAQ